MFAGLADQGPLDLVADRAVVFCHDLDLMDGFVGMGFAADGAFAMEGIIRAGRRK